MSINQCGLVVLFVFLFSASAQAGGIEVLRGKYAFDWLHDPAKGKCVRVEGKLLNDFKSTRYHCDLNMHSNSSSGAGNRTCTQTPGHKEYLIFDTKRECDDERETQATNE